MGLWDDYAKKKDLEDYTKKNTFNKKVEEIEATLSTKITKEDLPDHSIYALKEQIPDISDLAKKSEIPTDYLKKEDLPPEKDLSEYAKKSDLEGLIDKDCVDLSKYATKEELNSKAEVSEMEKRLCVSDFEKHKGELENKLKTYATKEEIPNISHLAEKELLNEYLLKKDLPPAQDLSPYVKKETLNQYVKKGEFQPIEIFYCMVKLKSDFRIYDGTDWAFEFYMGNRGNWQILKDTHNILQKPEEYKAIIPFKALVNIDFCFTCRKETHILKPRALQRIRSSEGEFINWQYHETTVAVGTGHDVTTLTFRDRVELLMDKGAWLKCSMEFDNRLHQHKKQWLHAVGSDGAYTPTYFSISGIKYAA